LAADLLIGKQAIADELGVQIGLVSDWVQKGVIPAKKVGKFYTATRSGLRQHFLRQSTEGTVSTA
jgi:hypothetical protein